MNFLLATKKLLEKQFDQIMVIIQFIKILMVTILNFDSQIQNREVTSTMSIKN